MMIRRNDPFPFSSRILNAQIKHTKLDHVLNAL